MIKLIASICLLAMCLLFTGTNAEPACSSSSSVALNMTIPPSILDALYTESYDNTAENGDIDSVIRELKEDFTVIDSFVFDLSKFASSFVETLPSVIIYFAVAHARVILLYSAASATASVDIKKDHMAWIPKALYSAMYTLFVAFAVLVSSSKLFMDKIHMSTTLQELLETPWDFCCTFYCIAFLSYMKESSRLKQARLNFFNMTDRYCSNKWIVVVVACCYVHTLGFYFASLLLRNFSSQPPTPSSSYLVNTLKREWFDSKYRNGVYHRVRASKRMRMCYTLLCLSGAFGCTRNSKDLNFKAKVAFCILVATLLVVGNIHAYVELYENDFSMIDLITEASWYCVDMIFHYFLIFLYAHRTLKKVSDAHRAYHFRCMTLLLVVTLTLHTGLLDFIFAYVWGGIQYTFIRREVSKIILTTLPGCVKRLVNMLYMPLTHLSWAYLLIMASRQIVLYKCLYSHKCKVDFIYNGVLICQQGLIEHFCNLYASQHAWSFGDLLITLWISRYTFYIVWTLQEVREQAKIASWLYVYAVTMSIFVIKVTSIDQKIFEMLGLKES